MISSFRNVLPSSSLRMFRTLRARFAAAAADHPSWQLVTVGVTGTNGKSTVVALIGHLLMAGGWRVGWVSTATVRIGERVWLNDTKLTTPGSFYLQDRLADMVRAGCRAAIIEVSSEGLAQRRHIGVRFDGAVFTNLTPEHIESHGSFKAYRQAKEELFKSVSRRPKKQIDKVDLPRLTVVNLDDEHANSFLQYDSDLRVGYSTRSLPKNKNLDEQLNAEAINVTADGTDFILDGQHFHLPLYGSFNVSNTLAALAVADAFGVPRERAATALAEFPGIPGRLEFIDVHQPFRVLVDYAPEPASMTALYGVLPLFKPKRIIHVFGSAGGGRDRWRRPALGELAARHADVCIVTNEDPYDEDPAAIIEAVFDGIRAVGRHTEGQTAFRVLDRREAIRKALNLAEAGDLVVVTGKACEQWIMGPDGSKVAWDDRRVIREEISKEKK